MANNNHGLGRGLASLIPPKSVSAKAPAERQNEENAKKNTLQQVAKPLPHAVQDDFLEIPIGKIASNPQQPRHDFAQDELKELAESIKKHGIIQPLVVTKIAPDQYELIAGERRIKAARMAGLPKVPVIVREDGGEREKLEVALIENIQRKDLNVIEESRAYKKLSEEFDLTQEEISERVGKSRSAVANKMRLLDLPVDIQRALIEAKISEGHGRSILAVENPEKQKSLFELILKNNLTVRQTEDKAREVTVSTHKRRIGGGPVDPALKEKEDQIAQHLGTKVQIKKSGGGGKIIIDYYSNEELENISRKISNQPESPKPDFR